jgi:hypothetical protein
MAWLRFDLSEHEFVLSLNLPVGLQNKEGDICQKAE